MIGCGGGDGINERPYRFSLRISGILFCLEPLANHRQFRVVLGLLDEPKPRLGRDAETAGRQAAIAEDGATLCQQHGLRRGQSCLPDIRVRERLGQRDGHCSVLQTVTTDSVSVIACKQRVRRSAEQEAPQNMRASFQRRPRAENRDLVGEDIQGLVLKPF